MRVVSVLPAATEIVAAIGGTDLLVGVSDACDFPPTVGALPRVTRSLVDAGLPSGEIASAVAARARDGSGPIALDTARLAEVRPDVVIGQGLCDVCAVGEQPLRDAVAVLSPPPRVVTLHPHSVGDVLDDIVRVGTALARRDAAAACVASLSARLKQLPARRRPFRRPRVLVLEWVDPPYVAGHWVPELVELAGGEAVGSVAGTRSVAHPWGELAALAPDLVVIALCGFDLTRARAEVARTPDPDAQALLRARVEFLDGNAYTSRPGPRVVDAAERLAEFLEG